MNILILGANSDMAFAIAEIFGKKEKANIYLASRDIQTLEKKATDLAIRCQTSIKVLPFDVTQYQTHHDFYHQLSPKPDGVIAAFGYLGEQKKAESSFDEARRIIDTNFVGAVSILEIIARDFEQQGKGFIIGISSVSGERGRQSNYIYGSAKGAFTVYLSGLRNRLSKQNVQVLTVLPGFVRTKMTADMALPEKLTAAPSEVAADIHAAWRRGKPVIYTKWLWRWIMLVIKAIPEKIFMKMKL